MTRYGAPLVIPPLQLGPGHVTPAPAGAWGGGSDHVDAVAWEHECLVLPGLEGNVGEEFLEVTVTPSVNPLATVRPARGRHTNLRPLRHLLHPPHALRPSTTFGCAGAPSRRALTAAVCFDGFSGFSGFSASVSGGLELLARL